MKKGIIGLITIILVILTTICYAGLSTQLGITSEVVFRVKEDIRVTNITYTGEREGNASVSYESKYSKDTITSGFVLPTENDSITYNVEITNNGDVREAIYAINTTSNNNGLIVYVNDVLYSSYEPIIINARTSSVLRITYKLSSPSNETINAVSVFTFKRVYDVEYNTNGGSSVASQIKYHGVNLTLRSDVPTKTGKVFVGWTDTENSNIKVYDPSDTYSVDDDLELYAIYRSSDVILATGSDFNQVIKQLAGNNNAGIETVDSNITSIQRSNQEPTLEQLATAQLISANGSDVDVWAWYSNGVIYYYTEAENIYMNASSSNMFRGLSALSTISISDLNTSNVTSMDNMFKGDSTLTTLDLSTFNMGNVTSASEMLNGMTGLNSLKTPSAIKSGTVINLPKKLYSEDKTEYMSIGSTTQAETVLKIGYTVTFNANGGSPATQEVTVVKDGTVGTLPTVTRVNHEFLGWYTALSGGVQVTENYTTEVDTTVYARWEYTAICKRASTLHTETCSDANSFCRLNGYSEGATITYGSYGLNNQTLTSGDAFDCDITGNGDWERFYYVSTYYDTVNKTWDNDYYVFIYYNDVSGGVASSGSTKDWGNQYYGPETARNNMPSTSQWSNVTLKNITRNILSGTSVIVSNFSYAGKAARLLTMQELLSACPSASTTSNSMNNCKYFFENTKYGNYSGGTYGPWLESAASTNAWYLDSASLNLYYDSMSNYNKYGARPVIEIPKTKIDLTLRAYTITYNTNGGNESNTTQIVTAGNTLSTLPSNPTRDKYTFAGWYTGMSDGTQITTSTVPSGNVTYYAHWEPIPICKRASTLHTENCTNTSKTAYCQGSGYALNSTVTYGSTGLNNQTLTSGDAFDCDVTGNGDWQRFYYVSDRYESGNQTDGTATFDSDYAVLIYYNNTISGVANTGGSAYATQTDSQTVGTCTVSNGCNWYGPVSAVKNLPTTSQWRDDLLKSTTRQIYAQTGATSTSGGTLPTAFSYSGYAGRLLTYAEVYAGCYNGSITITSTGGLSSKCEYLMENTYFTTSYTSMGFWLETPYASSSYYGWQVGVSTSKLVSSNSVSLASYGVRPTIEIPKTHLDLTVRKYTVKYDSNGGSSVSNQYVTPLDTLGTLPTPTKSNYALDGWYTQVTGGTKVTSSYTPNSSMTLYAHWNFDKYVVTYNMNGSSQANQTANILTENGSTVLITPQTRRGYIFDGWYTDATNGEKIGDAGDTYSPGDTVTIYAHWTRVTASMLQYNNTNTGMYCTDAQCAIDFLDYMIENGEEPIPICQRVTDASALHTEICSQNLSGTCRSSYASGATVTYGTAKALGSSLEAGDAFDCDINGNGQIDKDANGKSIERFYYVSTYFDTSAQVFNDNDTYVFTYYSDVVNGVVSPGSTVAWYTSSDLTSNGPETARNNLPTTSQWSNVSLKTTTRNILKGTSPTSVSSIAKSEFSYSGKAARLLTMQELLQACPTASTSGGSMSSCNYFFENTKYTDNSNAVSALWLETAANSSSAWRMDPQSSYLNYYGTSYSNYSARPVIEVLKSQVSY